MKDNRFQRMLREGRMPCGHMIMEFGTRGIARILESAGVDYVVVDMEHSGFGEERIADLMAWFHGTDIAPFVRVPQGLYHFIARTLDAGALGVMVANVESGEQARAIVGAAKYAPLGRRGVGLGTAHTGYRQPELPAYFEYANRNTTVICQIESVAGLANVEDIAGVEGVDVLWVGHNDLAQSMRVDSFDNAAFVDALRSVVEAADRHGKLAAAQPGAIEQAGAWFELGFHVLSWKTDVALYRAALQKEMEQVRRMAAARNRGE